MVDSQPKHKPNEKHTLDEVLKSLKDLVRNEVLDKSPPPAAASVPVAKPASSPSMGMGEIISSLEDLLDTDLTFEDKPKQPVMAAPPPAPEDSAPAAAELDETFEIDMTAEEVRQPTANFPDEMSDEDIAKVLADIELEMGIDAAPAPTAPAAELEFLDADDADAPITPAADDAAPALELTVQEPPAEAAEEGQRELPLTAFRRPPAATHDAAPAADAETGALEEEIAAAPAPTEPTDEKADTIELTSTPAQPAPGIGVAPAAAIDSDFTIDFTPAQAPPTDDELAPPPWEDDGTLERAEPPVHRGSRESAHGSSPSPSGGRNEDGGGFPDTSMFQPDAPGGMLGESIELDTSAPSTPDSGPAPAADAALPTTEIIAAVIESETEVIEEPDVLMSTASIELDITTPTATDNEPPAKDEEAAHGSGIPKTEIIEPVVQIIESETEVIEMAPDTLVPLPPGEIPVLKNVAVEGRTEPTPPPVETFTLELSPPAPPPPAPSSRDLHQVAVRVIAKLNIELRKAGKPPLDAKTINRLQQLLKEAMDKK